MLKRADLFILFKVITPAARFLDYWAHLGPYRVALVLIRFALLGLTCEFALRLSRGQTVVWDYIMDPLCLLVLYFTGNTIAQIAQDHESRPAVLPAKLLMFVAPEGSGVRFLGLLFFIFAYRAFDLPYVWEQHEYIALKMMESLMHLSMLGWWLANYFMCVTPPSGGRFSWSSFLHVSAVGAR